MVDVLAQDELGPKATVVLRLWTPARSRVLTVTLLRDTAILERDDRWSPRQGASPAPSHVVPRDQAPQEIEHWLARIGARPAGRTVLQLSVRTPGQRIWSWSEGWRRCQQGWSRIGFGEHPVAEMIPVNAEDFHHQVFAGLRRQLGLDTGPAAALPERVDGPNPVRCGGVPAVGTLGYV